MKIRTDFVTNSSSSSYIVTISVKPKNSEDLIKLDYSDIDYSEGTYIGLKKSVKKLISEIQKCTSIEQLEDLLIETMDLNSLEEFFEWVLDGLEEGEEDKRYEKFKSIPLKFKKSLSKIDNLDEIEKVVIEQLFYGDGECTANEEYTFLKEFNIEDYDWSTASARNKRLKELLEKYEVDELKKMLDRQDSELRKMLEEHYYFHATITKSIDLETGKITSEFNYK